MAVQKLLEEQGLAYDEVRLGTVRLQQGLEEEARLQLHQELLKLGFDLVDDHRGQLVKQIKQVVIQRVRNGGAMLRKVNFSEAITSEIPYSYHHISQLFSETEQVTLEKYIIAQKIEYVKELLSYDELSLQQIADRLGYSSEAHLSAQFKKVVGATPSAFKKSGMRGRKGLDDV